MIKIIRNIEDLENLKNEWNVLLQASQNNNVFLTYDWIYLWVKYFVNSKKRRNRLFIVCIYDENGKIEAIAPFFIKKFFVFFNVLMFISYDFSDYLDIIIDKQTNQENIVTNIFNTIKESNIANIIFLKQISESLLEIINKNKQLKYFIKYKESGDSYYINLPDGIDEYMKQFNSKQRYNILSRIEKAKKNSIKYINSENIDFPLLDLFIDKFFKLHQKRWNEKGHGGVFQNSKIKSFFKEVFVSLFKNNILALSFLKYNNEFISAAVCFDYDGKRQVYLPGFDTKYSNLYPGIVLTYYNINEAIGKKYLEFDFLKGDEDYKKRFLGIKRKNYKLYLYKNKFFFYIFKLNLFFNNEIKAKMKEYYLSILRKK